MRHSHPVRWAVNTMCAVMIGLVFASNSALAERLLDPAVIYQAGGKTDGSFHESAFRGLRKFANETGIVVEGLFEVGADASPAEVMRTVAKRGYDPILVVGFQYAPDLREVAPEFPDARFAIIDAIVNQLNVMSVVFREHEGSFLVGMLAALASDTGTIGFVGGMDSPLIRRFACGYVLGARHVRPETRVLQDMVGTTNRAWNHPERGEALARSQLAEGADVIFHAAGGTGMAVLRTVAEAGKLGIGVDSNQNHLYPGHVLTSMVKRVDQALYEILKFTLEGHWKNGIYRLGLAENGVDWALDQHNRDLVTPAMERTVEDVKHRIRMGLLDVHDYVRDGECPVN